MVCIDQDTAEKNEEPFVTLAKTRMIGGKVLFGQHATHVSNPNSGTRGEATIKVGDLVEVLTGTGDDSCSSSGASSEPEVEVSAPFPVAVAPTSPPPSPPVAKSGGFFQSLVSSRRWSRRVK